MKNKKITDNNNTVQAVQTVLPPVESNSVSETVYENVVALVDAAISRCAPACVSTPSAFAVVEGFA
jgi:hypothetical protein